MSEYKELKNLELRTKEALNELEDKLAAKKISKAEYDKWKKKLEEYYEAIIRQLKEHKTEDLLSVERFELYQNTLVQSLLTYFLEGKLKKITPFLDREFGVRYPEAERIMGTTPNETKDIIDKLVEANILNPSVYSKALKCPRCRSNNVISLYVCPFCQSPDFDKSKVIEHYKCHFMDSILRFKKDKELICPNCNSVLKQIGVDYQIHGPWFKCNECQKLFEEPLTSFSCGDCNAVFELQQATLVSLYYYTLNKSYRREYENVTIPLNSLIKKLEEYNWVARTPAFIIGVSGVIHQFFSAFWKGRSEEKTVLPIDPEIIMEVTIAHGGISSDKILSFAAKAQDVTAPIKLLVGIPRFELKAEQVAETYGISLLPVKNRDEFVDRVSDFILSKDVADKLEHVEDETHALEEALDAIDEKFLADKTD
ncbi:MAG: hypothetical protein ACTSQY_06580 [Candidatus Odinarchaeia archaeon]